MRDRVYPQGATTALTSTKRRDEKVQDGNLDRPQVVAQIGDTVPLAFASRESDQGGVWLTALLLRLAVKNSHASFAYLLSQGNIGTVASTNIFYGAEKATALLPRSCQSYETLPGCIDYVTGDVAWYEQTEYAGPGLPSTSRDSIKFTSKSDGATDFTLEIEGTCYVTASGNFVSENTYLPGSVQYMSVHYLSQPPIYATAQQKEESAAAMYNFDTLKVPWQSTTFTSDAKYTSQNTYWQTSRIYQRNLSVKIYSEVRYDYVVYNADTNARVRAGTFWVGDGKQTLSISGLKPGKYTIEIADMYQMRSAVNLAPYVPRNSSTYDILRYLMESRKAWENQNLVSALDGTTARNVDSTNGSLTQNFRVTQVTERFQINAGEQPGGASGTFRDLSLLGLKLPIDRIRALGGADYFKQVYAFCSDGVQVPRLLQNGGVGSSNLLPDLALYLLRKAKRDSQIDIDALRAAAGFTQRYGLKFDGVIQTSSNLREWLSATAPYFLCYVRQNNGRLGLVPALPTGPDGMLLLGVPAPVAVFTQETLFSYSRQYVPTSDRTPFIAVMVYRAQDYNEPGKMVTIEVKYGDVTDESLKEQYDMSDFCARRSHAETVARYFLARRRHITHTVQFETGNSGRQLLPADIIRIDLAAYGDSIYYQVDSVEEGQEGAVFVTASHWPVNGLGQSQIVADLSGTNLSST